MLNNLKLTPAMQFVMHSLLSVFIGALVSGLTVIGQDAFTGKTDLRTVCGLGFTGFTVYFTTNLSKLWSNPQVAQAALDSANQAKAMASQVMSSHQSLQAVVSTLIATQPPVQQNQPPVTVHVNTSPATIARLHDSQVAGVPEQPTQAGATANWMNDQPIVGNIPTGGSTSVTPPPQVVQTSPIQPALSMPTSLPSFSSVLPAIQKPQ